MKALSIIYRISKRYEIHSCVETGNAVVQDQHCGEMVICRDGVYCIGFSAESPRVRSFVHDNFA